MFWGDRLREETSNLGKEWLKQQQHLQGRGVSSHGNQEGKEYSQISQTWPSSNVSSSFLPEQSGLFFFLLVVRSAGAGIVLETWFTNAPMNRLKTLLSMKILVTLQLILAQFLQVFFVKSCNSPNSLFSTRCLYLEEHLLSFTICWLFLVLRSSASPVEKQKYYHAIEPTSIIIIIKIN